MEQKNETINFKSKRTNSKFFSQSDIFFWQSRNSISDQFWLRRIIPQHFSTSTGSWELKIYIWQLQKYGMW
jgi:hypothetical protein